MPGRFDYASRNHSYGWPRSCASSVPSPGATRSSGPGARPGSPRSGCASTWRRPRRMPSPRCLPRRRDHRRSRQITSQNFSSPSTLCRAECLFFFHCPYYLLLSPIRLPNLKAHQLKYPLSADSTLRLRRSMALVAPEQRCEERAWLRCVEDGSAMESSGPTRWAERCRVFREETGVALPSGGSIFKLHGAALLDG